MNKLYTKNKNYFITLVKGNREYFLLENVSLLQRCFRTSQQYYSFKLNALVVLPDHVHFIMTVNNIEEVPEIIRNIKRSFTTWYNESLAAKGLELTSKDDADKRPWVKGYDEYVIKSEEDLKLHLDYIHYNPVKHGLVKSPKEWTYSSFKSYVSLGLYHMDWNPEYGFDKIGCAE